jgi:hypothetical protein
MEAIMFMLAKPRRSEEKLSREEPETGFGRGKGEAKTMNCAKSERAEEETRVKSEFEMQKV